MAYTSYFVSKVDSFASLRKCVETGRWACKDRVNPPHPRDFLTMEYKQGRVVLIFSVVNNHGWHGIAEMTSLPCFDKETSDTTRDEAKDEDNNVCWHYFHVKWILNFLDFGEQCLPSKQTDHLTSEENDKHIPINKCRNWQQLEADSGESLCTLMNDYHIELEKRKQEKEKQANERVPAPFYEENEMQSVATTWQMIVDKVEKDLGKVILACPFGSQRLVVTHCLKVVFILVFWTAIFIKTRQTYIISRAS